MFQRRLRLAAVPHLPMQTFRERKPTDFSTYVNMYIHTQTHTCAAHIHAYMRTHIQTYTPHAYRERVCCIVCVCVCVCLFICVGVNHTAHTRTDMHTCHSRTRRHSTHQHAHRILLLFLEPHIRLEPERTQQCDRAQSAPNDGRTSAYIYIYI